MTCGGTKRDGTGCGGIALPSGLCWAHDPAVRDRADEARRRGGHNRSTIARATRRMPRDLKDLGSRLLEAFEAVNAGELAPDKAHAMARLASVYCTLYQVGEVETRLDALEAVAQSRKGWGA